MISLQQCATIYRRLINAVSICSCLSAICETQKICTIKLYRDLINEHALLTSKSENSNIVTSSERQCAKNKLFVA